MANKRISSLDDITVVGGTSTAEVNANDILPITDVDDTTGSLQGTTKAVKVSDLMGEAPVQTADISGLATQVSLGNHEALTSNAHGISVFGATLGLGTAATSASTDFYPSALATTSYTASGTPLAFTLTSAANNKVVTVNE